MAIDFDAWRTFADDGAPAFDRPVVLRGLLSDPSHVGALIDDAVRTATRTMHDTLRIRGFRQGLLDYRFTQALILTPSGADTANGWLARITDDRTACTTISDLTVWSLDLADWVQPLLKILLQQDRYDLLSGVDVYTFISDSGWTPFGIHMDPEPSMILHVGPAPKEVWVWPQGAIDTSHLPRNRSWYGQISFDFVDNLGAADHYVLQPGDFISIPTDTFHVFRNLGPSKFLGLSLYPIEVDEVVTQTFWGIVQRDFTHVGTIGSATAMADAIGSSLRDHPSTDSVREAMRRALHHAATRRRTFGYAQCPSEAALPETDAPPWLRWAYDGVIGALDRPDGCELLARGRSITFDRELDFTALVRASGDPRPVTRDELLGLLPRELTDRDRVELVDRLYRFGALRDDGRHARPE